MCEDQQEVHFKRQVKATMYWTLYAMVESSDCVLRVMRSLWEDFKPMSSDLHFRKLGLTGVVYACNPSSLEGQGG